MFVNACRITVPPTL